MSNHPHRSTTVEEHFFHKRGVLFVQRSDRIYKPVQALTCFVRPIDGVYYASYAECDVRDQFNRSRGRTVARRKWFAGKREVVASPTYEAAFSTYGDAFADDSEDAHLFIG